MWMWMWMWMWLLGLMMIKMMMMGHWSLCETQFVLLLLAGKVCVVLS